LRVGENGHIAFNDPPADFETEEPYILVNLDEACRRQQVGEAWFADISQVPTQALSMSVRQILKAKEILAVVPDQRKAQAVKTCFEGEISPISPASILRTHPNAPVYMDRNSASWSNPADSNDLHDRPVRHHSIANVLPSDLYWSESVASVSGLSGTGAGIGTILAFKLIGYFSDVRPATTHLFDPIVGVAELSRSLACFWSYCWFETRKPQGEDLYDRSKAAFLVDYFLTTAATQLISTSEFPGSAATATVVRAGPPFGK